MTNTLFADISSWQAPLTSKYPYPIVCFRVDDGWSRDSNASANWKFASKSSQIKAVGAYVVFIPGQSQQIYDRVVQFFGGNAPDKLYLMIDMESGSGFAGPGNHSAEANKLAKMFADYLGSQKRVVGYANGGDWASNWPTRWSWMKRVQASYGTQDPGTWQWQYYGGMAQYSSPSGYPRSCAPFGSNVDMNVIHKPIDQVLEDLGLEEDMALSADDKAWVQSQIPTVAQIATGVWNQKAPSLVSGNQWEMWRYATHAENADAQASSIAQILGASGTGVAARVAALQSSVSTLSKSVASLATAVSGVQSTVNTVQAAVTSAGQVAIDAKAIADQVVASVTSTLKSLTFGVK